MNKLRRCCFLLITAVACAGCREARATVDSGRIDRLASGHVQIQSETTAGPSPFERIDVATCLNQLKWVAASYYLPAARQRLADVAGQGSEIDRLRALGQLAEAELNNGLVEDAVEHSLLVTKALLAAQPRAKVQSAFTKEETERLLMLTAVSYLRLAEIRNCVAHCNAQSCFLPIRQDGIHKDPTPAREAFRWLGRLLDQNSEHLEARWLLNVTAMLLGEYPAAVPSQWQIQMNKLEALPQFPVFTNVAPEAHLNSVSLAGGVVLEFRDLEVDERIHLVEGNDQLRRVLAEPQVGNISALGTVP